MTDQQTGLLTDIAY